MNVCMCMCVTKLRVKDGVCESDVCFLLAIFRGRKQDISIAVCISLLHVCVCVDHLHRCKTSFRFSDAKGFFMVLNLWFQFISCRGAQKAHRAVPNEALYGVLRISRLITWTYLHLF